MTTQTTPATTTRKFALFLNGEMIGKPHSNRDVCLIEAYEAHLCVKHAADLGGVDEVRLAHGCEIKEVYHVEA
jgi:hypothetical protein